MGEGAEERSPNRYKNTQHSANMNNAKLGNKMKLGYTFNIGQSKVKRENLYSQPPNQTKNKQKSVPLPFALPSRWGCGWGLVFIFY